MSVAVAVEAVGAAGAGPQAAAARMAELHALVARVHGAPQATASHARSLNFSSALAGAGVGQSITAAMPAAAPTPLPGVGGVAGGGLGGTPSPFDGLIVAAAQKHGIDPALLKGLIRAESNFDPTVTSPAGAAGLAQLMPGTAASLGVTDRFDPAQSVDGGARYLRQQLDAFGGDVTKALAAYNAGPGAVQRYNGVPPYAETQAYVQKVQAYAAEYRVAPAAVPTMVSASRENEPLGEYSQGMQGLWPQLPPTTGSGKIT